MNPLVKPTTGLQLIENKWYKQAYEGATSDPKTLDDPKNAPLSALYNARKAGYTDDQIKKIIVDQQPDEESKQKIQQSFASGESLEGYALNKRKEKLLKPPAANASRSDVVDYLRNSGHSDTQIVRSMLQGTKSDQEKSDMINFFSKEGATLDSWIDKKDTDERNTIEAKKGFYEQLGYIFSHPEVRNTVGFQNKPASTVANAIFDLLPTARLSSSNEITRAVFDWKAGIPREKVGLNTPIMPEIHQQLQQVTKKVDDMLDYKGKSTTLRTASGISKGAVSFGSNVADSFNTPTGVAILVASIFSGGAAEVAEAGATGMARAAGGNAIKQALAANTARFGAKVARQGLTAYFAAEMGKSAAIETAAAYKSGNAKDRAEHATNAVLSLATAGLIAAHTTIALNKDISLYKAHQNIINNITETTNKDFLNDAVDYVKANRKSVGEALYNIVKDSYTKILGDETTKRTQAEKTQQEVKPATEVTPPETKPNPREPIISKYNANDAQTPELSTKAKSDLADTLVPPKNMNMAVRKLDSSGTEHIIYEDEDGKTIQASIPNAENMSAPEYKEALDNLQEKLTNPETASETTSEASPLSPHIEITASDQFSHNTPPEERAVVSQMAQGIRENFANTGVSVGAATAQDIKNTSKEQSRNLAVIGADILMSGVNNFKDFISKIHEDEYAAGFFRGAKGLDAKASSDFVTKIWNDSKRVVRTFENRYQGNNLSPKTQISRSAGINKTYNAIKTLENQRNMLRWHYSALQRDTNFAYKMGKKEIGIYNGWLNNYKSKAIQLLQQLAKDRGVNLSRVVTFSKDTLKTMSSNTVDKILTRVYAKIQAEGNKIDRRNALNELMDTIDLFKQNKKLPAVEKERWLNDEFKGKDKKEFYSNFNEAEIRAAKNDLDRKEAELAESFDSEQRKDKNSYEKSIGALLNKNTRGASNVPLPVEDLFEKDDPMRRVVFSAGNALVNIKEFMGNWMTDFIPVTRFFSKIAGGDLNHPVFQHIYYPIENGYRLFGTDEISLQKQLNDLSRPYTFLDEKELKRSIVRMATYALLKQGAHDSEILAAWADRGKIKDIIDDIRKNGLNAVEQDTENQRLKMIEAAWNKLVPVIEKLYNITIPKVEGYFTRVIEPAFFNQFMQGEKLIKKAADNLDNVDSLHVLLSRLFNTPDPVSFLTRSTNKDFVVERNPKARIPLNLDYFQITHDYLSQVNFFTRLQPELTRVDKINNDIRFAASYGDKTTHFIRHWIDGIAREGHYQTSEVLYGFYKAQNLFSTSVLSFRPNQFKHFANLPQVIHEIGDGDWQKGLSYLHKAGKIVMSDSDGKDFLAKVLPELQRHDFDFTVLAKEGRIQKYGFAIERNLDIYFRKLTYTGRLLNLLDDAGIDFHDYIKENGIGTRFDNGARVAMVNAIGSLALTDKPLAMMSKGFYGVHPTFLKVVNPFSQPLLVRRGWIYSAFDELTQGNKTAAFNKMFTYTMGSFLEASISLSSKHAMNAVFNLALTGHVANNNSNEKDQESLGGEYMKEVFKNFIGSFPTGSKINQIRYIAANPIKAAMTRGSMTGVPVVDEAQTLLLQDTPKDINMLWGDERFSTKAARLYTNSVIDGLRAAGIPFTGTLDQFFNEYKKLHPLKRKHKVSKKEY